MPQTTLTALLARNANHTERLPSDYFADVADRQEPAAVSVCCADSRVSQEGMWSIDEPGWLFTPSTIGNQVWDDVDGDLVVDGSVLYPMHATDTDVTIVVGHTGCGAVTAALETVRTGKRDGLRGLRKRVDLLVPVIEEGLEDPRVRDRHDASIVDQLVEYNVDRQVRFLVESDDVPESETVFGFVYDLHNVYGDAPGRAYLVNIDGVTDVDHLQNQTDDRFHGHIHRLLT